MRYGAKVVKIPLIVCDEKEDEWKEGLLKRYEDALKSHDNVKVLEFPWITTSTGHILPAKELCQLAREYNAFSVIDAAQAWAVIPIDFYDVNPDFMIMNAHKYLCGPVGVGFVIINDRILTMKPQKFWPTVVDDYNINFGPDTSFLSGGVKPYANLIALNNTLEFYSDLGVREVYEKLQQIGEWMRNGLSCYPDTFEIITPIKPEFSCIMTCFKVKGMTSEDVYARMRQFGVEVKHSTEGEADTVRIAAHYYNTPNEFNTMVKKLCHIANVNPKYWPPFECS